MGSSPARPAMRSRVSTASASGCRRSLPPPRRRWTRATGRCRRSPSGSGFSFGARGRSLLTRGGSRGGEFHPQMRVVHVVHCLGLGGQERLILNLSRVLAKRGHEPIVISLTPNGELRREFQGIPVVDVVRKEGVDL